MALQIFISYRRDDSAYASGRIYDRLSQHFGGSNVFMDIDAIELGVNFREKIERAVGQCDVLIAVIGKQWLTMRNERGTRRLDDPDDFVRLEILAALKRNIHVIPVLVGGASMPAGRDLPGELSALSERNGLEIRHSQFNDDCSRLIKGLEEIKSRSRPPADVRPIAPRSGREDSRKAREPASLGKRLGLAFVYGLIGTAFGLVVGYLATAFSGYSSTSGWLEPALIISAISGAIIGFMGTTRLKPILIGLCAGVVLVLGFYTISGEPIGDAVGSALVLGCGPGGVLGAVVDGIRSG